MRVLIFGTLWISDQHREDLLKRWIALHRRLNPDCDFLLVDGGGSKWPVGRVIPAEVGYLTFPDDIGSAVKGGRDGWGRAFTTGLQYAINEGYDYVVHIESDSLCRLPVMEICEQMARDGIDAQSAYIDGMKNGREPRWIETGLMFLRVGYVRDSDLIGRYDWPTLKKYPVTSESVLFNLLQGHLRMMPWKAFRNDRRELTSENVAGRNLDWITHCWSDMSIYDAWMGTIA